jgi:hypothetical protein
MKFLTYREFGLVQRQGSRKASSAARRLKFADVDPINAIEDAECPLLQLPANEFVPDRFDAELPPEHTKRCFKGTKSGKMIAF